jgi:hypothetical protein
MENLDELPCVMKVIWYDKEGAKITHYLRDTSEQLMKAIEIFDVLEFELKDVSLKDRNFEM